MSTKKLILAGAALTAVAMVGITAGMMIRNTMKKVHYIVDDSDKKPSETKSIETDNKFIGNA